MLPAERLRLRRGHFPQRRILVRDRAEDERADRFGRAATARGQRLTVEVELDFVQPRAEQSAAEVEELLALV